MSYVIQDSQDHSYIYTNSRNFNVGVDSLREARKFDSIAEAQRFMYDNFSDDYIPVNNIIEYKPGTIFTEDW